MDETLSETGEEMEVGNMPEPKPAEEDFTAQELLQDLSRDEWADTATPLLTSSPQKSLEHGDDTLEYRREQEEHV